MRLDDMVSGWMTDRPVTLPPEGSLGDACTLMFDRAVRHIPVVRDGKLLGIISDRDLTRRGPVAEMHVHELADRFRATRIEEVMTREGIRTVTPMTTIAEAARILIETKSNALPVVDGERLVGIITTQDLLRALLNLSPAGRAAAAIA